MSLTVTETWGWRTRRTLERRVEGFFWKMELHSTVLEGGPVTSMEQAEKEAIDAAKRAIEGLPDFQCSGEGRRLDGTTYAFSASYRIRDEATYVHVESNALSRPLIFDFKAPWRLGLKADPRAYVDEVVPKQVVFEIEKALSTS